MTGARPTAEAWDAHAEAWASWTRTPGHDHHYEHLNLPAFLALLPGPGRLTIDLGCGEGRLGRVLADRGHVVVGVDSSPTLAALARDAGGYREVLDGPADAVALPDDCADLVVAFMTLQDMDELDAPLREAARLLERGGRLCLAVPHPFAEMARERAGDPDYFTAHRYVDVLERNGVSMTFESWRRPLSAYTTALAQAGMQIEALQEPVPDDAAIAAAPELAKWRKRPIFMYIRAVLPDRQEWASAAHVERYLVRARTEQRPIDSDEALLEHVPSDAQRILDLGTGDGRLLALLLAGRPDRRGVGLDFSGPMLAAARERFATDERVELLRHDLTEPLPELGRFDAVVSSLAIHHLPHERKRSLYAEAYALLEPGGLFANFEHVASPSRRLHLEFFAAINEPLEHEDPSDRLLDVHTQLEWLRAIGFEDVDCHWKWRELALLAGVSPTA